MLCVTFRTHTDSTQCHTDMQASKVNTAAIVGCGKVGRNWALVFLRAGWFVRVFDPDPKAEAKLRAAFTQLRDESPEFSNIVTNALSFHAKLSEAVLGANWIHESAPDRIDLKRNIYQIIKAKSSSDALIVSSSETLTAADVQSVANRSRPLLIVRPISAQFATNKVIVIGTITSPQVLLNSVSDFLEELGLRPEIQLS